MDQLVDIALKRCIQHGYVYSYVTIAATLAMPRLCKYVL